jgi:hypothetical protein
MDALAVLVVGIGGYLMFEAFKQTDPHPITKAKAILSGTTTKAATTKAG